MTEAGIKDPGGLASRPLLLGDETKVEQATKEIPLGKGEQTSLGRGFVPGDLVRIEVGFFRHEMNLKEVFAFFELQEGDISRTISLSGHPKETYHPPSEGTKFSEVSLRAIVPADAAHGVYRFRRLEAETYGGRRVAFDEGTQDRWRRWRFLVREEPDTPPTI